jgi:hypothetical protein
MADKLLIVEDGEYSDFTYTPLFVPEDFELAAALRAYEAHVREEHPEMKAHSILTSFAAFLAVQYGARDPEPGEILVVDDPVRYGNWQPRSREKELLA